jgi:hypothetical protein
MAERDWAALPGDTRDHEGLRPRLLSVAARVCRRAQALALCRHGHGPAVVVHHEAVAGDGARRRGPRRWPVRALLGSLR